MVYRRILALVILSLCFCGWSPTPQKVITILYTSDSHGNLYPCDCGKQEDGGMSRRYTLVNQIKNENPNTILIEGGSFFAGGQFDESKNTTELDKIRTEYYLKCIDLMGYDLLTLGEDEFLFGEEFLSAKIKETKTPFVATNISETFIKPYIMKQVTDINVAILSICPHPESTNFKFFEWKDALKDSLIKLKSTQKVDLIILITRLDEKLNKEILEQFPDINLILAPFDYARPRTFKKVGKSLIVYPTFEGRRLTRVDLFLKETEVANFKVRSLRLSDQIKNAFEIARVIPRCFSDKDCRKASLVGHCENPGTLGARCVYTEPLDITITVIQPKKCFTCQMKKALAELESFIGGECKIKYVDEDSGEAKKIIKLFEIKMLPAYIASKDIEKSLIFDKIREGLIAKEDKYLIPPSAIGVSYFIGRNPLPGKLDLFVLSHDKNSFHIFSLAGQLNESLGDKFDIHFIVFKDENGKFLSPAGDVEVEEALRMVCIKEYYPKEFWDYALERIKNINSAYWDDTAQFLGIDVERIKKLAKGKEGERLLSENIKLTKELDIGTAGTFLLNNQEIFGMTPEAKLSEIQNVFEGKQIE